MVSIKMLSSRSQFGLTASTCAPSLLSTLTSRTCSRTAKSSMVMATRTPNAGTWVHSPTPRPPTSSPLSLSSGPTCSSPRHATWAFPPKAWRTAWWTADSSSRQFLQHSCAIHQSTSNSAHALSTGATSASMLCLSSSTSSSMMNSVSSL